MVLTKRNQARNDFLQVKQSFSRRFFILLIKYLGVFESPTGGESSDDYVCFFYSY